MSELRCIQESIEQRALLMGESFQDFEADFR